MLPSNKRPNKPSGISSRTPANPGGSDGKAINGGGGDVAVSFISESNVGGGCNDTTIMDTSGFGYLNHNNKLAKM